MGAYQVVEVFGSRATATLKRGFYVIDSKASGLDLLTGKVGFYYRYTTRLAAEAWLAERDAAAAKLRPEPSL